MPTPQQLRDRFWKALKSDVTMMIGLEGIEDGHARPMAAQFEHEYGPIWFFTTPHNALLPKLKFGNRAVATFTSRDHDLFATLHGSVCLESDCSVLKRLWNPTVAAWFGGGKDDPTPKVELLKFKPERAEIWVNECSFVAGVKMLFGVDPQRDYKDMVADVRLS